MAGVELVSSLADWRPATSAASFSYIRDERITELGFDAQETQGCRPTDVANHV